MQQQKIQDVFSFSREKEEGNDKLFWKEIMRTLYRKFIEKDKNTSMKLFQTHPV